MRMQERAVKAEQGTQAALAPYERRFRRAGLPLFIVGYSPFEDVFTRAVPLLGLVFVIEMLGAGDLDWSVWANLAAVAGGLAILVAGVALVNRRRGRRARGRARDVRQPGPAGAARVARRRRVLRRLRRAGHRPGRARRVDRRRGRRGLRGAAVRRRGPCRARAEYLALRGAG
jgi:hypothetical protein